MKTSTALSPCQQLESHLQQQWSLQNPALMPVNIRCGFQKGRLLVVAEHSATLTLDVKTSLNQLVAAIQGIDSDLRQGLLAYLDRASASPESSEIDQHNRQSTQSLQVGIYLKRAGASKPYSAQGCWLRSSHRSVSHETLLNQPRKADGINTEHPFPVSAIAPSATIATPPGEVATVPPDASTIHTQPLGDKPLQTQAERLPGDALHPGLLDEAQEERGLRLPLWVWAVGAGLCLSTFVGSFWFMLQPCIFRPCEPLLQAKQIRVDAEIQVIEAQNWQDLQAIETRLEDAKTLLKRVPRWSKYKSAAEELEQLYGEDLNAFEPITIAFERAIEAVNKSQNPPHPVETWQAAQGLWEAAIAQLESIPPENPTYSLARRKREQYTTYLQAIGKQLQQEKQALQTLKNAEEAAILARQYQDNAASLETWKSAQTNWELAIRALESIPKGTTSFNIAQDRIQHYQTNLTAVDQEEHQAQFAANLYNQALDKARQAAAAEAENLWDVATSRWRAALDGMKQIPEDSPYYLQASALIRDYTSALWRAELQSRGEEALDRVRQDLANVCTGTPTICYFTVTADLLVVQLTLDYQQAVLSVGVLGDEQGRTEALENLRRMESALEIISNTSKIPLELYDPDGVLIGTHTPTT